ncbi:adenylate/guanylate cyclase domain-containing protein [Oceanobacter mangrovi]|uniref:adenylate/guanylate cyclase domain-containing protein n=1 Tax=Oceanobacter mangrovi TaxID=2862510 RepID=UPI001C8D391D|nr:adenylate/guanylate cyclase domain-containing protein [Oceanobacter mangrovi]
MTTQTTDIPAPESPFSARPDYVARCIGYGTGAITIATGISLGYWHEGFLIAMAFFLVFPHFTEIIDKRLHWTRRTALTWLSHLDAFIAGTLLGMVGSPIEFTAPVFLMLNTSLILIGNKVSWVTANSVFLLTAVTGGTLLGTKSPTDLPPELTLACAAGTALFFSALAVYASNQARYIAKMDEQLRKEVDRYQELSQQVSKYVAPQVRESILSGKKEAILETQRKKLVVFFSDIVGFSSLSDQMDAEPLTDLLNGYLTDMSNIALKYGGTIDKFIGDGIMIFFGDPVSKGIKRDALACVAMAIEMRRHMLKLRKKWAEHGLSSPLQIRMGINTGYCTVGNFGTDSRMDYTIVGREVNLASRLESGADAGEILISRETYALIKDKIICRERGTIMAKGFRDPIPVFQVMDYRRDLGANPSYVNHETEGFSLYMESDRIKETERAKVAEALERAAAKLKRGAVTSRGAQPATRKPAAPKQEASKS